MAKISLHNFKTGYRCKKCGYVRQSMKMKGRIVSELTRKRMKKSHWANRPVYKKEMHPRYGTQYPTSWCKGLAINSSEKLRLAAIKASITRKSTNIKLSDRHKQKISIGTKLAFQREEVRKHYRNSLIKRKAKRYPYGSIKFRSKWEILFAQRLDAKGIAYDYESQVYDFHSSNGKRMFYLPDFYLKRSKPLLR